MARQNRVTPEGAIIADPARGMFMGGRGILHDEAGRIVAPFRHRNWVCCLTAFKGRRRPIMAPRRYTELFFLDEATALAAGHRPCAECRRADYNAFRASWAKATGLPPPSARDMDRALHAARVAPRSRVKRTYEADVATLPDGAFVRLAGGPALVRETGFWPSSPSGYGPALPRPASGPVTVLTPEPTVEVLRMGYAPRLHPSAG
ncbi:MAG: hypothetical protein R3E44_14635 [Paracoccaceae bacterium]